MNPNNGDRNNDKLLTLSLSTLNTTNSDNPNLSTRPDINLSSPPSTLFPLYPQLIIPYPDTNPPAETSPVGSSPKKLRARRLSTQVLRPGKTETIPQPYPWATTKRATVHSVQYLKAMGITTISGKVQCKRCARQFEIEYDLHQKLTEMEAFIVKNKDTMRHRAAEEWMNPRLPDCKFCHQSNCLKPVGSKKKAINWLFLLLGQMLGCCKLSELKYFCKHTRNHRTGAKDRVLYLTYFELCRQLHPHNSQS